MIYHHNDDGKIVSLLPKWLKFSIENNVEELHLSTTPPSNSPCVVPNTVFEGKSLIVLKVCGWSKLCLGDTININCHYLKTLDLSFIHVDEWTIQNIVCSCPLIEEFQLMFIDGLERIRVANLFNLKIFSIMTVYKLKEVSIEAPKLQSCTYQCFDESVLADWFTMDASQCLKCLLLYRVSITDTIFHKLLSRNPHLEILSLSDCNMLEHIKVSSPSLKWFSLFGGEKLVELIISSSNLLSLTIGDQKSFQLTFPSVLGQGKPDIHIYYSSDIDISRFYELRVFLTKFKVSSVCLAIMSEIISFTEDWRAISLPPKHEVEKLELEIALWISQLRYPDIVNGLFWSCHPKTLSIYWNSFCRDFLVFLCKEFRERRNGKCCNSDKIKCWRHHLRYWKIKHLDKIRNEWKPLHWKALVDGSVTLKDWQEISFTLEWGQLDSRVHEVDEVDEQKLIDGNDRNVK